MFRELKLFLRGAQLRQVFHDRKHFWFKALRRRYAPAQLRLHADPGIDNAGDELLNWLCMAQDASMSNDGGVAGHYSPKFGWSTSYPETTGYIIPTMPDAARRSGRDDLKLRARRMLDFLCAVQFDNGSIHGGYVGEYPCVGVTFNTGQVLQGFAAGVLHFGGTYRAPLIRAADWLCETQDEDGCWRSHPTPFAACGEKTYETHVARGLYEAYAATQNERYLVAANKNLDWALSRQLENGWFRDCCLEQPMAPLTHTIGYAIRGFLSGYHATGEAKYLAAARSAVDGALSSVTDEGFLAGRFHSDWDPAVTWSCLTGSAQFAECCFMLYTITGSAAYLEHGQRLSGFVRRTLIVEGDRPQRGAVAGSAPFSGEYGKERYPNWGAKFLLDALFLESDVACAVADRVAA